MLDTEFFPEPNRRKKKFKRYEFDTDSLENFLKGEMIRPTWDHNRVESLYASCIKTKKWADMHEDQREDFCKFGRIALQNINCKYGKGMDIVAYHFPGLKQSVVNKGYYWDPGF